MLADTVAAHADELGPAELRVAEFLVAQIHRVGHLSAARIGAEVGVSDATVVRTARRLGFGSLADLRESAAGELGPLPRLDATLRRSGSSPLRDLLADRVESVARIFDRVDEADLVAVIERFGGSSRVVAAGFGPTAHLARYAAHQLRRVGVRTATVTATGSDLADELLDLTAGDTMLILSYERASAQVAAVGRAAAEVGASVVLITDVATAEGADTIVLPVGRGTPGEVASHASTIVVLEMIAVGVAAAQRTRATDSLAHLEDLRAQVAPPSRRRPPDAG